MSDYSKEKLPSGKFNKKDKGDLNRPGMGRPDQGQDPSKKPNEAWKGGIKK